MMAMGLQLVMSTVFLLVPPWEDTGVMFSISSSAYQGPPPLPYGLHIRKHNSLLLRNIVKLFWHTSLFRQISDVCLKTTLKRAILWLKQSYYLKTKLSPVFGSSLYAVPTQKVNWILCLRLRCSAFLSYLDERRKHHKNNIYIVNNLMSSISYTELFLNYDKFCLFFSSIWIIIM
jgi:hypothetical protein